MPTFGTSIRNPKTGANLGFKGKFASLADAFKARGDKNVYSEGTGLGTRTPGPLAPARPFERISLKDDDKVQFGTRPIPYALPTRPIPYALDGGRRRRRF